MNLRHLTPKRMRKGHHTVTWRDRTFHLMVDGAHVHVVYDGEYVAATSVITGRLIHLGNGEWECEITQGAYEEALDAAYRQAEELDTWVAEFEMEETDWDNLDL